MGTQWIQIPRRFLKMDKGTKFVDVLVYAAIDYQKDSSTHTSKIGMRTIADKYNIPLSKVEDAVKRLKESGYLDFTQHTSPNNTEYKYNQYTFPLLKDDMAKDGFLMLKPEVLSLPLKPKDRGILIYLQLIALPNMNDIVETKIEDIGNRIGICRQTASKYLKQFLASGYIIQNSRSGMYKCQYLAKDKPVDKKPKEEIPFYL